MYDTKAVQILKTFTPEEFKKFGKFIHTAYFNSSKDAIKLFSELKKYHPDFKSTNIDIKKIYKKVYPGCAYHEGKIRNVISDLGKLLEAFLSIEYFRADEFKMEEAKIYQFHKRKLNNLYEKSIGKVLVENKEINSMYKENYTALINLYELKVLDAMNKLKVNKGLEDISRQSEYITLFFLNAAFNAKESILINRHNYNADYPDISAAVLDAIDFEKVLKYAKENSKEVYPILALTYYVHKVFMIEDFDENLIKFEKIYEELRQGLDKKFHAIILATLDNAFLYKRNHAKTREELDFYARKSFNIYKFMDEEGLFAPDETFGAGIFKIIATTGAMVGNLEWALMFIEKYKHLLRDELRDDIVNYALASLYEDARDFEKCLYHYNQIKKPDYMTLWQMKMGMGNCHYELKNFETVLSLCDSTLVEMKRKYKGNNLHDSQMEFFVLLRKLTKLRLNYTKKNLEDFELYMEESRNKYGETGWFECQLRDMKKLFDKKKIPV